MIIYKTLNEVSKALIYGTFEDGFSDYPIKIAMDQATFFKRFFGPEGNMLEHSYIAMKENQGIGLVFGGIRQFDGLKTMRCGTMCISPKHRRQGIGHRLMTKHIEKGAGEDCDQMFLEVLSDNEPAITLYELMGYKKVYDLEYYSMTDFEWLESVDTNFVEKISFEELVNFRKGFKGLHINWQNEIDYIAQVDVQNYGIKIDGQLVAAISTSHDRIFFIGVHSQHRNNDYGKILLKTCLGSETKKLSISFPNNSSLLGYCLKQ